MKILIAEEDVITLQRIMRHLSRHGHSVIGVENGQQAINTALKESLDLVVIDNDVPLKDGVAVIREIQATKPELETWLFCPHITAELDGNARKAGARKVIDKNHLYDAFGRAGITPEE